MNLEETKVKVKITPVDKLGKVQRQGRSRRWSEKQDQGGIASILFQNQILLEAGRWEMESKAKKEISPP